jgi:hypothetical protein
MYKARPKSLCFLFAKTYIDSKRNMTHDMSGHGLVSNYSSEYSIIRGDPGVLGK